MKKRLLFLMSFTLLLAAGCGANGEQVQASPAPEPPVPVSTEQPSAPQERIEEDTAVPNQNPIATITMKDGGIITAELYYDVAPISVTNFIYLANSEYYDGVIFHRVIPGFMIQGGDPTGTGTGGPGYRIKGEFTNNRVENNIKHTRGVLSMARQGNPYMPAAAYNTAGSQFFIMHADYPSLDGDYAAFGCVTDGMDIVDAIANTPTDSTDKPIADQVIASIRVETFGVDYGEPERIND